MAMHELRVSVEQVPGMAVVRLTGDVTAANIDPVRKAIAEAIALKQPKVAIDLAETLFLSSPGLAVLVRLMRQARQHKQPMHLLDPVPHIERMLRIANMPIGG